MYIYTIIITICRVGAIWSRKIIIRKTFQSISNVVFMIMIIDIANKKNKIKESYDRKKNRKVYAQSRSRFGKTDEVFPVLS